MRHWSHIATVRDTAVFSGASMTILQQSFVSVIWQIQLVFVPDEKYEPDKKNESLNKN